MEELIKTLIDRITTEVVTKAVKNIQFTVEDTSNDVMTVEELANYLKVSTGWVYQNKNQIPHTDIGGYKFYKASIKKWLEERTEKKGNMKISNKKCSYKIK